MTQYQFDNFFEDLLKDTLIEKFETVEVPRLQLESSWEKLQQKLEISN
ncbi:MULTISPECIES: hypothetical protein [Paenibacillus]|uniref:Uncharacterized protein n=1 Tax=Paenibacillus chitinolyticus TaxID=79263 RepID=A0ABT4FKG8_9BACL|nr:MULTISPECIES: hypothetical protein [Paenibacillus]EGL17033.1 hypothetical protein HMPREF9413_3673 [Paenibacillus sp. HGF7]EPD82139.1 hypothetical protein HMPREF1207_03965 [Paenibacillus sp. HGH0039]MBV6714073.1 hypothetical protein [Paenibacillus chitinolyticus]MCY9593140.1 hypothetical protein [Paenibacillus chitinolyticus]MCY9599026.1 hypothetical protein [Paenibacillus chitinolyticus]